MANLGYFTEKNKKGMPLSFGAEYVMDVEGMDNESGACFGLVGGVKVYTDPRISVSHNPGDSVIVLPRWYHDKSMLGEVIANEGCFLEKAYKEKTPVMMKISEQSYKDVRDCVGIPSRGGGYMGVFTVFPRTRSGQRTDPDTFQTPTVSTTAIIRKVGKNTDGSYYIIANPSDDAMKRDDYKELFAFPWRENASKLRTVKDIKKRTNGIPEDTNAAIFFRNDGSKTLLRADGTAADLSTYDDGKAIEYYMKEACGGPGKFKLAVYEGIPTFYTDRFFRDGLCTDRFFREGADKGIKRLKNAAKESSMDIFIEEMPWHFFKRESLF